MFHLTNNNTLRLSQVIVVRGEVSIVLKIDAFFFFFRDTSIQERRDCVPVSILTCRGSGLGGISRVPSQNKNKNKNKTSPLTVYTCLSSFIRI